MLSNKVQSEEVPTTPYDSSVLYRKMREEWESLQNNPSALDDQIKNQLEMLEQINNNAFNEKGKEGQTNASEIGKLMQAMMRS